MGSPHAIYVVTMLMIAGFTTLANGTEAASLASLPLWYNETFEVRGDIISFDLPSGSFTTAAGTVYTYTRSNPTTRVITEPPNAILLTQNDVKVRGESAITGIHRFTGTERIFDGQYGILTLQSNLMFTQILFPVGMLPAEFERLKAFNIEQIISYTLASEIPNDSPHRVPPPSHPGTGPTPLIPSAEAAQVLEGLGLPPACCSTSGDAEIIHMGRSLRNTDKSVNIHGNYLETAVAKLPRFAGRAESADEIQLGAGFTTFTDVVSWAPKLQTGGGKYFASFQSVDGAEFTPFVFYIADVLPPPGAKNAEWSVSVSPSVGLSFGFAGVSLGVKINDPRGAAVERTTTRIALDVDFSVDDFPDRNDRGLGIRAGMGAIDGYPGFYFMRFDVAMEYAYPTVYTYRQPGMPERTFWTSAELSSGDRDPIWISIQADNWSPGSGGRFGEYSDIDLGDNAFAKWSENSSGNCPTPQEYTVNTKVLLRDTCADWVVVSATSFYYEWPGITPDLKGYLWRWDPEGREYVSLSGACGSIYDGMVGQYLLCGYYVPREGGTCPAGRVCLFDEGEYYEVLLVDGQPVRRTSFVVQRFV